MEWKARRPVIIGVGESIDREVELAKSRDPAALMVASLRNAARDAGMSAIPTLDRLDVVNEISWPYPDPCAVVADRLGQKTLDARYHAVGGQTPTLLIHEAAIAIARGEIAVAAVCGGEAQDSVRRAQRAGVTLDWPASIPDFRPIRGGDVQLPVARALELTTPTNVYPLYENACRAAWGQTLDEAQAESATIWAGNAAVARTRAAAWLAREVDADTILSPADGNRLIAWPYRKLMVANPIVNQGAAVIVASLAWARAAGVPDDRMVFVHGGAAADDTRDILARRSYHSSPVMEAVLGAACALAPDGFDAVELYSCFPCVPKMARRTLGLAAKVPLTVAGGLTFFGAPLNNYMSHAVVAMVERLRAGGGTGLLYGQGEYVTKHHALVLGGTAATEPLSEHIRLHDVETAAAHGTPPLDTAFRGEARIETFTLLFDRAEQVRHGIVIARNAAGARIAARVEADDRASIALLMGEGVIVSAPGQVVDGVYGLARWCL